MNPQEKVLEFLKLNGIPFHYITQSGEYPVSYESLFIQKTCLPDCCLTADFLPMLLSQNSDDAQGILYIHRTHKSSKAGGAKKIRIKSINCFYFKTSPWLLKMNSIWYQKKELLL